VAHLTVVQRTASWVLPRHDRPWTVSRQRLHAGMPLAARLARLRTYLTLEVRVLGFGRLEGARRRVEGAALARLARQVPDPVTRAALTPHYPLGCKRVLLSDDYWPTFTRPNVDLVSEAIDAVRPRGVRTVDGVEHELDALVLATGFDLRGSFDRMAVTGLGGLTLEQAWSGIRGTNLGITVAGFPELYLLLGPNTALGHSSVLLQIESAIAYVLAALRAADARGPQVLTRVAQERFGRWVRRRTRHTVWGSGCQSWSLDERGRNVAIWPASTARYRWVTRRVRSADYEPALTPPGSASARRPG
jgi:cation diffusion facilitator CzcD-associated flavoprotein CzcO